jgi:uncharacterized membrane protein
MRSQARFLGHPIHQMLIVFPVGLLVTAIIFDIIRLLTGDPFYSGGAYILIASGIIGGLLAAPFGYIDWLKIPNDTRAKDVGRNHGIGNVVVLVLFIASWWLRRSDPLAPTSLALFCSFVGVVLLGLTAWLGGELVDRLGVGVDEGANVNAPSSLSGKPLRM